MHRHSTSRQTHGNAAVWVVLPTPPLPMSITRPCFGHLLDQVRQVRRIESPVLHFDRLFLGTFALVLALFVGFRASAKTPSWTMPGSAGAPPIPPLRRNRPTRCRGTPP
ncbi:hypothetical protein [Methylocaldum marinum]